MITPVSYTHLDVYKRQVNEEIIYQEYNITMVKEGDRYYIKDMNSKISNINY